MSTWTTVALLVLVALVSQSYGQTAFTQVRSDLTVLVDATNIARNAPDAANRLRTALTTLRFNTPFVTQVAVMLYGDQGVFAAVLINTNDDINEVITLFLRTNGGNGQGNVVRALQQASVTVRPLSSPGVRRVTLILPVTNPAPTAQLTNAVSNYGQTLYAIGVGPRTNEAVLSSVLPGVPVAGVNDYTGVPAEFNRLAVRLVPECAQCNYNGFAPDSSSCLSFFHCVPQADGTVMSVKQTCGSRQFWSQQYQICDDFDSFRIECRPQECLNPASRRILRFDGNTCTDNCCKDYYECENGQIKYENCPANTFFDGNTQRCIPRPDCVTQNSRNRGCRAIPGDPCRFIQIDQDQIEHNITCGDGTSFDQSSCSCSNHNLNCIRATPQIDVASRTGCSPDLSVQFQNQGMQRTGRTILGVLPVVENEGDKVQFRPEGALFDGAQGLRLAVPRYNGNQMRLPLAIRVRYRETNSAVTGGADRVLVSNAGCDDPASISISVNALTRTVTLGVRGTNNNNLVTSRMTYGNTNPNALKDVLYIFNGTHVYGRLRVDNSPVLPIPATLVQETGRLAVVPAPLQIGSSPRDPPFIGYINRFEVYQPCDNPDALL